MLGIKESLLKIKAFEQLNLINIYTPEVFFVSGVAQYNKISPNLTTTLYYKWQKRDGQWTPRLDFPLKFMFHTHFAVTPEIEIELKTN